MQLSYVWGIVRKSIFFLKSLRPLSKLVGKSRFEIIPSRIGVELLFRRRCIVAVGPPMTLSCLFVSWPRSSTGSLQTEDSDFSVLLLRREILS